MSPRPGRRPCARSKAAVSLSSLTRVYRRFMARNSGRGTPILVFASPARVNARVSHTPPADATSRFSDRVRHYVLYRPTYPPGLVELLRREGGLTNESVVADVGSGTGISSEPFLRHGNTVYAVEPNSQMRAAAEASLGMLPGFVSVHSTAEQT